VKTDFLSRRTLFATIAASWVSWIAGNPAPSLPEPSPVSSVFLRELLTELFSDLRCAAAIGRVCLRASPPQQSSLEDLASSILAGVPIEPKRSGSLPQIRYSIRERIRSNFTEGDTLSIDGWILSVTETRLYVLAARLLDGVEEPDRPATSG